MHWMARMKKEYIICQYAYNNLTVATYLILIGSIVTMLFDQLLSCPINNSYKLEEDLYRDLEFMH